MSILTCSVADCERQRYGRMDICSMHYKRIRRNGTTDKVHVVKFCTIDGCGKPRVGGGLCSAHYTRKVRTGDPLTRKQGEVVGGKRICPKCEVDKDLSEWGNGRGYCRPCESIRSVEWLKKHPRRAEIQRNANLARRARKMGALVERFSRDEILERDGWVCGICDEDIDKSLTWPHLDYATIDHIIPLARGGEHSRKNVQAAHYRCNCSKKDDLPTR